MSKLKTLPRMALGSIRKNGPVYLPYMLICSFTVFVYFIFLAISKNPMMENVPHASYVVTLMMVGVVLLSLILAPILIATNNYLLKQRKKELGLYSILGMEKKHIGVMLCLETLVIYLATLLLGIAVALVFSKLLFLLLLNISGLPVDVSFTVEPSCYAITAAYFGVVSLVNLLAGLVQVSKANPAALMQSGRQGEKQPKHLWLFTLLGILTLGTGYWIAWNARLNSMIFTDFFFSVLLVVAGTYFLFTSGSIVFLRMCKKNKKRYYQPENFVTVSGMLYRMKKSAASLVNICIFGTAVIVTLTCTVSLFLGQEESIEFQCPYDASYTLRKEDATPEKRDLLLSEIQARSQKHFLTVSDQISWRSDSVRLALKENAFTAVGEEEQNSDFIALEHLYFLSLDSYHDIGGQPYALKPDETLVFTTSQDFGYPAVSIGGQEFTVKEELGADQITVVKKEERNQSDQYYWIIFSDDGVIQSLLERMGEAARPVPLYEIRLNVEGALPDQEAFYAEMTEWADQNAASYVSSADVVSLGKSVRSMDGGLLFLGIFFGVVFTVCLILLMYYKQVSEGYEDQRNFEIMRKVGMSDREMKSAVRRQILTVFFLPMTGAVLHTLAALSIIVNLMGVLLVFNEALILWSALGVVAAFGLLYGISYGLTARSYYKIVRQALH